MNLSDIKRVIIGEPFPNSAEIHERLDKVRALAVFASDPISSNAYATEAIMGILVLLGSGALQMTMTLAIGVALLVVMVIFSYIQTILHYPDGGGAYTVAKDNLGTLPSLIAAGALLTDYVLTVSVSVSAGVRAVTSAFPETNDYRVMMALGAIAIITWLNLRGVRESGTIFAFPTYAFVAGVLVVVVIGLVRHFGLLGVAPLPEHGFEVEAALTPVSQVMYIWLLLRAFSAGCTALTGIEAISNGIQAFKPPESKNAAKTMVAMGFMAMSLFLGISFLSTHLGLIPNEENSVLSQMAGAIVGRGHFLYYWVQFSTMLILFLAANTGFQDFPRLSSFLAKDDFLPRWLQNRGDRLVYSWGIVLLASIASLIVIVFRADEIAMLPLYALGVMLSFTLSQAGMVRLWGKVGRLAKGESAFTGVTTIHHENGWWWKRAVNFTGSLVTGVVFVILVATKFIEGAWIIVLAIPALVLLFHTINRHYNHVAEGLRTHNLKVTDLQSAADVVLVPIADIHRGSLRAIKFARRLSSNIRVITVVTGEKQREHILSRWERFPEVTAGADLVFIEYVYRDILDPLISYIEQVNNEEYPDDMVMVVVPEFIPESPVAGILHNQTARLLHLRLRQYEDIIIIQVPHHL
nr:APC family permease [Anaerolineae bacterium]